MFSFIWPFISSLFGLCGFHLTNRLFYLIRIGFRLVDQFLSQFSSVYSELSVLATTTSGNSASATFRLPWKSCSVLATPIDFLATNFSDSTFLQRLSHLWKPVAEKLTLLDIVKKKEVSEIIKRVLFLSSPSQTFWSTVSARLCFCLVPARGTHSPPASVFRS